MRSMTKPLGTNRIGGLFARVGVFFLTLLVAGLLSSCSCSFGILNSFKSGPSVRFDVAPTLNNTSALAVDVVLIYDKALLETLLPLSASEWFARRDQLRKDYPEYKKSYKVWPLELVPNQDTTLAIRDLRCVKSGIVFADYYSPGDHRVHFVSTRRLEVALRSEGFEVSGPAGSTPENP